MVQDATRGDHHVEVCSMSARSLEVPHTPVVDRGDDFVAEAKMRDDPMVDRNALEVRLDLVPGREHAGEIGIRSERVRVDVRRDVASDAGIGVLAPRAAGAVGLLETDDVGDAGLAQLDHCEDAGHACPDHANAQRSVPDETRIRHGVSHRSYVECRPATR